MVWVNIYCGTERLLASAFMTVRHFPHTSCVLVALLSDRKHGLRAGWHITKVHSEFWKEGTLYKQTNHKASHSEVHKSTLLTFISTPLQSYNRFVLTMTRSLCKFNVNADYSIVNKAAASYSDLMHAHLSLSTGQKGASLQLIYNKEPTNVWNVCKSWDFCNALVDDLYSTVRHFQTSFYSSVCLADIVLTGSVTTSRNSHSLSTQHEYEHVVLFAPAGNRL